MGLYIYKNYANHLGMNMPGLVNGSNGGGNFSYMRLDSKPGSASLNGGGPGESLLPLKWSNLRNVTVIKRLLPSAFLILCIGLQTILSSALWNYSLITFSNILETDALTGN